MSLALINKVALITGGARGIGRATAIKLASVGVDIAIVYYNSSDEAAALVEELHAMGRRAIAIQANVSDHQSVKESVRLAKHALEHKTPEAQEQLAHAINLANHCFFQWVLVSERLQQHMQMLKHNGAIAVKPTGSGGGGFVLSLWNHSPLPADLDLIAV